MHAKALEWDRSRGRSHLSRPERNDECLYLDGIKSDFQTAEVARTGNAYGDEHVAPVVV
jgi:hypothetical protein